MDSLKALVALGASINVVNNFQHTPYDTAMYIGSQKISEFLKEVGGVKGVDVVNMHSPRTKKPRGSVFDEEGEMREMACREGK